ETGCAVKRPWSTAGVHPPGNWFAPPGSNQSTSGGNETDSAPAPVATLAAQPAPSAVQTTEDQLAKLRELLAAKRSILLPINAVAFTNSSGIVGQQRVSRPSDHRAIGEICASYPTQKADVFEQTAHQQSHR